MLLFLSIFLLFFSLEQIIIFYNEYSSQNTEFSTALFSGMENPLLRLATGSATYYSLWLVFCEYFSVQDKRLKYVPLISFVVLSIALLCLPSLDDATRKWAFYSMRQLFVLWICGYCIFKKFTEKTPAYKTRYQKKLPIFFGFAFLAILIFIEDTFVMLALDPATIGSNFFLELLYRRNISETIFALLIAAFCLRLCVQTLTLKKTEKPQDQTEKQQTKALLLIPYFTKKYNMTAREKEIFAYLTKGFTNHQIASELQVAEGTVKTHIHNIFKKTNVHNREELLSLFWSEE